jgi:hypothetical protein
LGEGIQMHPLLNNLREQIRRWLQEDLQLHYFSQELLMGGSHLKIDRMEEL